MAIHNYKYKLHVSKQSQNISLKSTLLAKYGTLLLIQIALTITTEVPTKNLVNSSINKNFFFVKAFNSIWGENRNKKQKNCALI